MKKMTSIYILIAVALIGIFLFYMYKNNTVDSDSSDSVPDSTSTPATQTSTSTTGLSALTEEELTEGWYYGTEKRPGTPDTWVFQGGGTRSARWVDPSRHATINNN